MIRLSSPNTDDPGIQEIAKATQAFVGKPVEVVQMARVPETPAEESDELFAALQAAIDRLREYERPKVAGCVTWIGSPEYERAFEIYNRHRIARIHKQR